MAGNLLKSGAVVQDVRQVLFAFLHSAEEKESSSGCSKIIGHKMHLGISLRTFCTYLFRPCPTNNNSINFRLSSRPLKHLVVTTLLDRDRGKQTFIPNQQCTLNKFSTELQCRNFINAEHTNQCQMCKKKCMQCVYITTELPFCMPPSVVGWQSPLRGFFFSLVSWLTFPSICTSRSRP